MTSGHTFWQLLVQYHNTALYYRKHVGMPFGCYDTKTPTSVLREFVLIKAATNIHIHSLTVTYIYIYIYIYIHSLWKTFFPSGQLKDESKEYTCIKQGTGQLANKHITNNYYCN